MKMNKKELQQFDSYVEELGRGLKNTILWESSDKYLRQQCEYKYDSFLVNYIERYMGIQYEDIKNDMKLKSRFDKILFPVLKDMREELKVEHEEKIKEERKRAREKGVWNYNCGLIRKRTLTSEYKIYYLK